MAQAPSRFARLIASLALGLTLFAHPALAKSPRKAKVVWTEVVFPDGKDRPRLEAVLKPILEKEGRRAKWGKGRHDPVEAEIHVKELHTVVEGDILRVTCAATGKIKGLGAAKSKVSYGGKVTERAALEKRVLELVARGIIGRLSEMARADQDSKSWHVTR